MKKWTRIVVEYDYTLVALRAADVRLMWCGGCGREVGMVDPGLAALLSGTSVRGVSRWAEAGRVHAAKTAGGRVLFCVESLPLG